MQMKQQIVKLTNQSEGDQFIQYLEQEGLKNIHSISYKNLHIKCLVVDSDKFFSTNVTCIAAALNCGIKPISIENYKALKENKKVYNEKIDRKNNHNFLII